MSEEEREAKASEEDAWWRHILIPVAAVVAGIAFSDLRIEIAGRDFGPEAIVAVLALAGVLTFAVFSFLRREERPYDQLAELRGEEPER